jgi:hypothetical protein
MHELINNFQALFSASWNLIITLLGMMLPWTPLMAWVAFWLLAVNWVKLREVMIVGGCGLDRGNDGSGVGCRRTTDGWNSSSFRAECHQFRGQDGLCDSAVHDHVPVWVGAIVGRLWEAGSVS